MQKILDKPLANILLTSTKFWGNREEFGSDYINTSEGKVKDFNAALSGACDILVETFAHNIELKEN